MKKAFQSQVVFIFIFVFVLYANTLSHKYALDDLMIIQENTFTKKGLDGVKDIMINDSFTGFFGKDKNLLPGGRYRPLSQVTFAIEYAFFGINPFVSHLLNLLFYALLGVFILKFLRQIIKTEISDKWFLSLPFVITVLYLAHPIHTEAVANIKGRDEILGFLGSIAALYFSIKYVDTKRSINLIFSFLWFLVGLLSKESAITFIAIIPLTLFMFRKPKIKEYLYVLLPVFGSVLGFFMLRYNALGFVFIHNIEQNELLNNPFVGATASEKFATISYTMGKYIKLLLVPHPLTHDYYPKQIPIINWADLRAILPLIMYLLFAVIGIWGLLKKNLVAYALLFYLITFSIVSNVFINVGAFMNERFMFAPSLGFSIILGVLLYALMKRRFLKSNKVLLIIFTLIIAAYTLKTITRNNVWKDDYTLFTNDVEISTNSAKVNVSAGGRIIDKAESEINEVKKEKMLNDALKYTGKGVEIHPKYTAGWLLYGNAYLKLKHYQEAYQCYENCLKINKSYTFAINNLEHLAQVADNQKNYKVAEKAYTLLVSYKDEIKYHYQLAMLQSKQNNIDSAIVLLKEIINRDATYDLAYDRLGEYYGKYKQDIPSAIKHLEMAVEINPSYSSAWENLGIAYGMRRDFSKSMEAFKKAIEVSPEKPSIYENLALTYLNLGMTKEAEEMKQKAIALRSK